MRLLDSRTLNFKEFIREDSTPLYAILSHTWEDDEVTFKDMRENRTVAESKAGFKKIKWCAKQALADGLDFIWVDTCCIDKSSSSELSEAINSMFRWYRNSQVCYAYLSDVSAKFDDEPSGRPASWDECHSFMIDEVPEFIDEPPKFKDETPEFREENSRFPGTNNVSVTVEDTVLEVEDEIPDFMKDEVPDFVMNDDILDWIEDRIPGFDDVVPDLKDEMQEFERENRMPQSISVVETETEEEESVFYDSDPFNSERFLPAFFTGQFEERLVKARWFGRGWTLQELIAPLQVVFYTKSWVRIGSKHTHRLITLIEDCTGIPKRVLRHGSFSSYSIAQRMSWAASRVTSRVEDTAYCLMGLFEIHMPMLYGEGERAFIRLQEEIIKQSNDMSIFFWTDLNGKFSSYRGLLARAPFEFAQCRDITWDRLETSPGPEITSQGIKLTDVCLCPHRGLSNNFLLVFPGVRDCKSGSILGIFLQNLWQKQFARVDYDQMPPSRDGYVWENSKVSTIFVHQRPILTDMSVSRLGGIYVNTRHLGSGELDDVTPSNNWEPEYGYLSFKEREGTLMKPLVQFSLILPDVNITLTLDTRKRLQSCLSTGYRDERIEIFRKPNEDSDDDWVVRFNVTYSGKPILWVKLQHTFLYDDSTLKIELNSIMDDLGKRIDRLRK